MGCQDSQPDDLGCQRGGGKFAIILVANEAVPSILDVVLCYCKTGCGSGQCMYHKLHLYLICVTVTNRQRGHD